jgi:hypothetical protein
MYWRSLKKTWMELRKRHRPKMKRLWRRIITGRDRTLHCRKYPKIIRIGKTKMKVMRKCKRLESMIERGRISLGK